MRLPKAPRDRAGPFFFFCIRSKKSSFFCQFSVDVSSINLYNYKHRQRRRQQMFQIIDMKTGKVAFSKLSASEAHKRVDLLNSSGIIRYRARSV